MTTGPILVLGASGTLGQALLRVGNARGWPLIGAARRDADHICDIREPGQVTALWQALSPSCVINCAGLIDLAACEANPGRAYETNAHGPAILARLAAQTGTKLIQISTDQFYTDCDRRLHTEEAPVHCLHAYGASKLAGETLSLTAPNTLVVRTNLTGLRGWSYKPTFAEWCIDAIINNRDVTLFDDYYTSTIDADTLAACILDLIRTEASGTINVAAREAFSKADFVRALARNFGITLTNAKRGSAAGLTPSRGLGSGLDVARAETLLGRSLPTLADVTSALHTSYLSLEGPQSSWTMTHACA